MPTCILRILRGTPDQQKWEEFELEIVPYANIISYLMMIQRHPVTNKGEQTTPVVWESGCLEEVCGACSMLINGRPRQACTALVDRLIRESHNRVITIAPFSKFPLIRDLIVDRTRMFDDLKKIQGWIETDLALSPRDPQIRISPTQQELLYSLSKCMTCGCCLEACPQVNHKSTFIGPAAIAQVRLFDANPLGQLQAPVRLHALMGEGGVSDCGNSQNCVRVCPKELPLTDSIAELLRSVVKQAFRNLFSLPDHPVS